MTRPVHEIRLPPFKVALFIFVILIFISLSFLAGYKAGISTAEEKKPEKKKFITSNWKEVYQLESQQLSRPISKKSTTQQPRAEKKPGTKSKAEGTVPEGKVSTGNYAVQVAAFTSKERADREAERFRKRGYSTSILIEVTSGKKFYKVLVGPYKSYEEARAVKRKLEKEEKKKLLLRRLS